MELQDLQDLIAAAYRDKNAPDEPPHILPETHRDVWAALIPFLSQDESGGITVNDLGQVIFNEGEPNEINLSENIFVGTYDEIKNLKDASELTIGRIYIMSDHQTRHLMPYTTVLNVDNPTDGALIPIEPIALKAISTGEFSGQVTSLLFPLDVINYNIDNLAWGVLVHASSKGFISYRKVPRSLIANDNYSDVEAPQDVRFCRFRRWNVDLTAQGLNAVNYIAALPTTYAIGTEYVEDAEGSPINPIVLTPDPNDFIDSPSFKSGSVSGFQYAIGCVIKSRTPQINGVEDNHPLANVVFHDFSWNIDLNAATLVTFYGNIFGGQWNGCFNVSWCRSTSGQSYFQPQFTDCGTWNGVLAGLRFQTGSARNLNLVSLLPSVGVGEGWAFDCELIDCKDSAVRVSNSVNGSAAVFVLKRFNRNFVNIPENSASSIIENASSLSSGIDYGRPNNGRNHNIRAGLFSTRRIDLDISEIQAGGFLTSQNKDTVGFFDILDSGGIGDYVVPINKFRANFSEILLEPVAGLIIRVNSNPVSSGYYQANNIVADGSSSEKIRLKPYRDGWFAEKIL